MIIRNIIRDFKNLKFQMQLVLPFPFISFHFSHYFKNNGPSGSKVNCSLFSLPFQSLSLIPSPIPLIFSLSLPNCLMYKQQNVQTSL